MGLESELKVLGLEASVFFLLSHLTGPQLSYFCILKVCSCHLIVPSINKIAFYFMNMNFSHLSEDVNEFSFKFFCYFPELSLIAPISLFLPILFLTFMFKACFNV